MNMYKTRVFVSFDFDNDKTLKEFIIGQSRLPDSPFEVTDWSMKDFGHHINSLCMKKTIKMKKGIFMEKRFCKNYQNDDRLEISFLAGLPIMAEDTTPGNPPNEEMKRDKNYFEGRKYNANLVKELQQRGFSEDI